MVPIDNLFNRTDAIERLRQKLPEFMVPATWVELVKLPLTSNGKIDKKALLKIDTEKIFSDSYRAPVTDWEIKLVGIWQDLLGVKRIGVEDNFFELGGNSLLAMRMVSYIERNLQVTIPLQVLFQARSISDLSKYFEIQTNLSTAEKNTGTFELIDV